MEGRNPFTSGRSAILLLCLFWTSYGNEKCEPFPSGEVLPDVTSDFMPGDAIRYDFNLTLHMSATVSRVVINITATSLKFSQNDSTYSVAWQLIGSDGNIVDRNSSSLSQYETPFEDGVHSIVLAGNVGGNFTLQGSMDMVIKATAGAGDLVQSVLEVTMTHSDNSTCFKSVGSLYFYLPPPRIWVSSESPLPVPMMDNFQGVVSMLMTVPHVLGPSVIEMRTPSEESSLEVILTIQSASISHITGFNHASTTEAQYAQLNQRSTFASFQNDVGEMDLPALQRDVANFSSAELGVRYVARAEDFSELHDGVVVNVSVAMTLGRGHPPSDGRGGNLIWVSGLPATLQAPPLDLKRPELNVTLRQKSSCAYDGETRASVEVHIVHSPTSTATAYNVTARVYLTDAMTVTRHVNSELRRNSLSVTQNSSVVYMDIERMTFSDPTTVTLDLDIDLSDPRHRLASHYVITADAIFSDRWGNNTGMFSPIDYVSLQLDKKCSQRLNWTTSSSCTCPHDVSRSDCACCVVGACPCGVVNPSLCQPCDRLHLCQPYLEGFAAISELDAGDGKTTYICDAHQRYRAWTKGVSCYRRTGNSGSYKWFSVNPIVGAILARDMLTGSLYGISNNGLAHMRSEDGGVTWYTIPPEDYASKLASVNIEEALLLHGGLETQ